MLYHAIQTRILTVYRRNWKPDVTKDDGSTISERHWGVMYANRTRKYNLDCGTDTDGRNLTAHSSGGPCRR